MLSSSPLKNYKFTPAQILALGYLALIIIGTVLLSLPIATTVSGNLDFISALFTATSATCVTGLSVVNTATGFTFFGQVIIMFLIQIGGLGLMVISTMIAFLIGKKINLKERLILREDLNQFKLSGVVRLVKYVLLITLTIEVAGGFFLFLTFINNYPLKKAIYYSVFHAISAFNNAGMDLFGNSLGNFTGNINVNFVIIALIILGGLGFAVIIELFQVLKGYNIDKKQYNLKKPKYLLKYIRDIFVIGLEKTSLQTKIVLVITLILFIVGFLGFLALEYTNKYTMGNLPIGQKILSSFFLSITPRTAGFYTIPTANLRSSSLFLIIILMFIGASPGSTGGGIKTTTFGVLLITVWNLVRGKTDIQIFKRQLEKDIVIKSIAIIMLSLILVVVVTMVLTISEDMDFLPVFFETVSAFGTVGLSTGITTALSNFAKIIIIFTMFIGRVGPLTLAIAFAKRKKDGVYHYPKEKIMVG